VKFERDRSSEFHGGHLVGYFTCSYAHLVKLFGEPHSSDGYKVSSEWWVTDGQNYYSIYDYKETSMYDGSLPSVEEFRALPQYEWHIGGTSKPSTLIDFLEESLKG
jgi:hypothetical protein